MRHFLTDQRNEWLIEVINSACSQAGLSVKDISHLIYLNDARPGVIEAIASPLGVPISRTNSKFAKGYGHMGAADQLISLGLHLDEGDFRAGDIVALCGISSGMQWCSALVRI